MLPHAIGCDVVHIPRFVELVARTPAMRDRIFLPSESAEPSMERLAGWFAAKEAACKALGVSAGHWHDLELTHESSGAPRLRWITDLSVDLSVSISHDGDYAFAVVIATARMI